MHKIRNVLNVLFRFTVEADNVFGDLNTTTNEYDGFVGTIGRGVREPISQ